MTRARRADREPEGDRSALALYMAELQRYPRPSADEEEQLRLDLAAGRPGAVERLAQSALAFVVRIARQYIGQGLSFEELLNEGNIGLMEGARRFDPNRGNRFTTYAVWWIRKSILSALSRISHVSYPHYQWKRLRRIRSAERLLSQSLGEKPTRREIAAHLGESPSRLDRTLQGRPVSLSLNQRFDEGDERSLERLISDDQERNPEIRLLHREEHEKVAEALGQLPPRERLIIELRYGFADRRSETLLEIGKRLSLSRERVRQIEALAKTRLRRLLAGQRRPLRRPGRPPRPSAR